MRVKAGEVKEAWRAGFHAASALGVLRLVPVGSWTREEPVVAERQGQPVSEKGKQASSLPLAWGHGEAGWLAGWLVPG